MKKYPIILALLLAPVALVESSCTTPPDQRVAVVQTLKSVGEGADAVVAVSAHLYGSGKIRADQAIAIKDFYDTKFQPAFRDAVTAAQSDLSVSSPAAILSLGLQLSTMLTQFQNQP